MPELPEVETVVRSLRPYVLSKTVTQVTLNRTDILDPPDVDLSSKLKGRTIRSLDRRGKRIIFTLSTGDHFYIHLGMSGQLTAVAKDAPLKTHTHLILHTNDSQIRFRDPRRFGGIWWLGKEKSPDEKMGPEPLTLRSSQLAKALGKTRRAIKSALLDQQVIAGLGNIYVDEALHKAGIHPLTPADHLKPQQIARLNAAIKSVLKAAIQHRGSTLRDYHDGSGKKGRFQHRHRVYHQTGKPCQSCGKPISRIVLGGRSTHFCKACQKK